MKKKSKYVLILALVQNHLHEFLGLDRLKILIKKEHTYQTTAENPFRMNFKVESASPGATAIHFFNVTSGSRLSTVKVERSYTKEYSWKMCSSILCINKEMRQTCTQKLCRKIN